MHVITTATSTGSDFFSGGRISDCLIRVSLCLDYPLSPIPQNIVYIAAVKAGKGYFAEAIRYLYNTDRFC
jgi:hypothetical protein